MRRVLLTGVSGAGKSTIVGALRDRGYKAVDTDHGGYCSPEPDRDPPRPVAEPGWVWHERRIRSLLETEDCEVLFVSGCVPNQGRFYASFDHIVLLFADPAVVRERLRNREGNPYGKRPGELERAMRDQAEVEPLLRRGASSEIDTRAPLDEVVERLLAIVL